MNEWISKIDSLIQEEVPFPEMLSAIDRMRRESIEPLLDRGLSKEFACAFLLKISNFLVGKFQYRNRHDYQVAFPFALIVDPSNSCPLHCPGCLHNRTFQHKMGPDWPEGNLTPEQFSAFINQFGPYASTVLFYNWGEPLLNRHTPDFVRQAKSYLLNTSLSSNLSVKFDTEALVLSGLDYMILSIDGATRASYEHYRRGGRFDIVIDNVKKLVEAKKKHRMATPKLSWQFLVFEHNKHEIEHAKAMAMELGVNDIRFAKPYDVIWEEDLVPSKDASGELYVVGYEQGEEYNRFDVMGNLSPEFVRKCDDNWIDKLPEEYETMFGKRSGRTCQWLYSSITMDAHGRYLPCCYVPRKDAGFSYIFADKEIGREETNPYNSELYRFSRKHFVWLSELEKQSGVAPMLTNGQPAPYCVACPDRFGKPLVSEAQLKRYLELLDRFGVLSPESVEMIANWDA